MKLNIKKFFICLIVFSCAMFIGHSKGLALQCMYNVDFEDRFQNTINGSDDEVIRKTLINYASNLTNPNSDTWTNIVNGWTNFVSTGYPKNVSLEIKIDDSSNKVNFARLLIETNETKGNTSDMTEDFKNVEFKECPNSIVTAVTCSNRLIGCNSTFITSSDFNFTDISTYNIEVGFKDFPAVRIRLARELEPDEKTENAINQCNGKVYDGTKIDLDEIKKIIGKIHSEIPSKIFNVDDISQLNDGELQNLLYYFSLSSYFDDCNDINSVIDEMKNDSEKLKNFQSAIKKCVKDIYPDAVNSDIKISGLSLSQLEKLNFLLERESNDSELIKTTCDRSDVGEMKDVISLSCAKWLQVGYSSYEECYKESSIDLIKEFNCENIANYAIGATNNLNSNEDWYVAFVQQNIDSYMNSDCKGKIGTEKKECVQNACEQDKNNYSNADARVGKIDEQVNKITDDYNKATLNIYNDITNVSGIKTDTKICDFLGPKGIGNYIDGALNVTMIGGVLLTIALSIMDGIKVFASFKEDENRKFFDHLKIRLICIALLIIIPNILKFLVNLVGKSC